MQGKAGKKQVGKESDETCRVGQADGEMDVHHNSARLKTAVTGLMSGDPNHHGETCSICRHQFHGYSAAGR